MNSESCGHAVATDGGRWWIRDTAYSEPNGDWTAGCFLGSALHPFHLVRAAWLGYLYFCGALHDYESRRHLRAGRCVAT